jgi:hypothetical protein
MKSTLKVIVGAAALLALAACSPLPLRDIITQEVALAAGATPIRVLSIADARFNNGGWTLDGAMMVNARSKLLNPANFGPGGKVTHPITITDTAAAITLSMLANYDVLFIGYMPNIPGFASSELTAMTTWVNGGGVMIVTADDTLDDQALVAFGYGMTTSVTPGSTTPSGAGVGHPVFSGPFGTVSAIAGAGSEGKFMNNLAGQQLLGLDSGNGIWSVIEVPIGSGRVLFLADVDFLSDDSGMNANNGISASNGNEVFLGNVFAYEHR